MARNVAPIDYKANVAKLGELIKEVKIAMLTTMDDQGRHRSRPMGTQQVEFDGDLWFFTGSDSEKAREIAAHPQVNVSYADPGANRYVSVSGKATLVEDADKMEELWNPIFKAWFPDGLDDPTLTLLRVEVEEAEYWEAPPGAAGMVATVIGFVQGVVSGEQADIGENEKLQVN
jgi:general stress protein 26